MSISGYRRLIRCLRHAFKNDSYAIKEGKAQLRAEFLKYKDVTNQDELRVLYRGIEEVEETLNFNIVQGKLNSRGRFEVPLSSEHIASIDAIQKEPLGPVMEPLDRSILGKEVDVRIDKYSSTTKR